MYKTLFFLLLLSITVTNVLSQPLCSTYSIQGKINCDTGTIILMPIGNEEYYPLIKAFKETKIEKGNFVFEDSILYPYFYMLGVKENNRWKYLSNPFLIDPCSQIIECDIDSLREIPRIDNNSTKELRAYYTNPNIKLNNADTILLQYCKEHPNSYMALWLLCKRFSQGYKSIYDSIYIKFSSTIKNTFTARALCKKLAEAKIATLGSLFPQCELIDLKNKKIIMRDENSGNKYTLIDFWYSHCSPCLSQFPSLKNLYAKFKQNGFEIIGISIDNEEDKKKWVSTIQKYSLPWIQYLDIGGIEAQKLGINSYPTNFLLDKKGIIIKKNLTIDALKAFLEKNIYRQ